VPLKIAVMEAMSPLAARRRIVSIMGALPPTAAE
jgi:hypothetical protein